MSNVLSKGTSASLVISSMSSTMPWVNVPAVIQYSGCGVNTRLMFGWASTANVPALDMPMPTVAVLGEIPPS